MLTRRISSLPVDGRNVPFETTSHFTVPLSFVVGGFGETGKVVLIYEKAHVFPS